MRALVLGCQVLPLLLGLLLSPPATGDDRRLFQRRSGKPYVFLLADASAGMALGLGGEWVPAGQDDPASRAYQLRKGVYGFLAGSGEEVSVGWARFDISEAEVRSKHRVYTLAENPSWLAEPPFAGGDAGPPWNGPGSPAIAYPRRGHPLIFGGASAHDGDDPGGRPDDDTDGSCLSPENLDQGPVGDGRGLAGWTDTPALSRLWTFAKLGAQGDRTTRQWLRYAGEVYRLSWIPSGLDADPGVWPESLDVSLRLERASVDCSEDRLALVGEERLRLVPFHQRDLAGEPLVGPTESLLGLGRAPWVYTYDDFGHGSGCSGGRGAWDGNRDDLDRVYSYDTLRDPLGRDGGHETFDRGDRLPLDWRRGLFETDTEEALMTRLAPNVISGSPPPDFRVAPHISDPVPGEPEERLVPVGPAPLLVGGERALAGALQDFGRWYERWKAIAEDPTDGDPGAGCRGVHLVLVVGGGEACEGQAESAAAEIRSGGVSVAVVLLAREPSVEIVGELDRLAVSGGTCADRDDDGGGDDCAWIASSARELENVLQRIVGLGSAPGGVTAGSVVPPLRTDLGDRQFLTGFSPVDEAVYPGWIHAFARPVPTDGEGRPDVTIGCSPERRVACHLWDAQRSVLLEQYDERDPVGPGPGRRQIFYTELGVENHVPGTRHFFAATDESTPAARRHDLWRGFDIDFVDGDHRSEQLAEMAANAAIRFALAAKSATDGAGARHEYLLGDVFHSTPLVLGAPSNLAFLETEAGEGRTGEEGDCDYSCFTRRHRRRRQILVAGSNDGMLHGFDAGVFRPGGGAGGGSFDGGSGRELFAYVPRPVLPTLRRLATERPARHRYTVDGGLVAHDVFIDPVHEGTGSADPPVEGQREWRTVLIGALRRGGERGADLLAPLEAPPGPRQGASGLYALDLTQPDPVESRDLDGDGVPESVPRVGEGQAPPGCLGGGRGEVPPGCGPIPWATPLWEFTDALPVAGGGGLASLDEDGNGLADLAFTWSRPGMGRIRVCPSAGCAEDELEDRYVAVFGGGLDPEHPLERGDWLYMVDVETGQAIYKRRLRGAAPSEPAVVDLDFDGYLDRVYQGTSLGLLYRVDLWHEGPDGEREYPRLETVQVSPSSPVRLPRVAGERFSPRILFEANDGSLASVLDGSTPPRPLYFAPSVLFSGEFEGFVLAMGTGNREDLFATGGPTGRFYVFVDDVRGSEFQDAGFVPLRPEHLTGLAPGHSGDIDLLRSRVSGASGWYLDLLPDERLVAAPFGIAGAVTFSTWSPSAEPGREERRGCLDSGSGRLYALDTATAATLLYDASGAEQPFLPLAGLAGSVFVEPARIREPLPTGVSPRTLAPGQERALERLEARLPESCRFAAGVRLDLRLALDDGQLIDVLPIPVCIRQRDYREP